MRSATGWPDLKTVISVDASDDKADVVSFGSLVERNSPSFDVPPTGPDEPALMISPRHDRCAEGSCMGTGAGRAYSASSSRTRIFSATGRPDVDAIGLGMGGWAAQRAASSLMLGVPVVSSPAQKFDADMAYRIMAEMKVRNGFISADGLAATKSVPDPRQRYDLKLRTNGAAGEALGAETHDWASRTLGINVNEFYGQTECNFVPSSNAALGVSKPGDWQSGAGA